MSDDQITTLYKGKYLQLVARGTWEYATRSGVSGVVAILAITPGGKILLVEQFRNPVQSSVIELPAGLAGDLEHARDEDMADAARRELVEETGYDAARFELLNRGPSSAGLTDEMIVLYRAHDLKKVDAGGGDATENITVHEVPLVELRAWLQARSAGGALIDFKVWAALAFAATA